MATVEVSKAKNEPGIYRHPETGVELEARHHPKYGSAMADGFVRVGYVYVGPAKTNKKNSKVEPEQDSKPEQSVKINKPLAQMNKTELLETASQEGVDGVSEETTNKKIVEAIKAQRKGK